MLKVYIGYDAREDIAYQVARHSAVRHAQRDLAIYPLKQAALRELGIYTRRRDKLASTDFSLTRFLTPWLAGPEGWSIFVDCDFLFTADITSILDQVDPSKAVYVVQHDYTPAETIKMDGQAQTTYPRKNWSSFILFNNAHPKVRALTPDIVNREGPAYLHRFSWLDDDDIGALDLGYNFLVGEYPRPDATPICIHYTNGGPWFEDWTDVDFADEWLAERERYLKAEAERRSVPVDIHIGVHKTATTFIQGVLAKNADLLEDERIEIPHHRQVRKTLSVPTQLKAYERMGQKWNTQYSDEELATSIGDFIDTLYENEPRQILLSDENLVGHCGHVVKKGLLYSHKTLFLQVVREFITPVEPRRILFGVRDYVRYFSAVYGQYLLDVKAENFVPPDVFVDQIMRRYPNWANFTAAVAEVFPDAEIVIWPYEMASADWGVVFAELLSPEVAAKLDFNPDPDRAARPTMSAVSYSLFCERLNEAGAETALEELRGIRSTHDTDTRAGKMNIFTPEQAAELQRRYAKHMGQLAQLPGNIRVLFADEAPT